MARSFGSLDENLANVALEDSCNPGSEAHTRQTNQANLLYIDPTEA